MSHLENNLALLHGFLPESACSITFENEQPQGTYCRSYCREKCVCVWEGGVQPLRLWRLCSLSNFVSIAISLILLAMTVAYELGN